jgi:transketolase
MRDKTTITSPQTNLDQLSVNAIRFLSVDAVQNANSGHPGMPQWSVYRKQHSQMACEVQLLMKDELLQDCDANIPQYAADVKVMATYVGSQGDTLGIDHFGASAPGPLVKREFGFTVENVCDRALALLEKINDRHNLKLPL